MVKRDSEVAKSALDDDVGDDAFVPLPGKIGEILTGTTVRGKAACIIGVGQDAEALPMAVGQVKCRFVEPPSLLAAKLWHFVVKVGKQHWADDPGALRKVSFKAAAEWLRGGDKRKRVRVDALRRALSELRSTAMELRFTTVSEDGTKVTWEGEANVFSFFFSEDADSLCFRIHPEVEALLMDPVHWVPREDRVIASFTTKYGPVIYDELAAGLGRGDEVELSYGTTEFARILGNGVAWGNLNRATFQERYIGPTIEEINGSSALMRVSQLPVEPGFGFRVTSVPAQSAKSAGGEGFPKGVPMAPPRAVFAKWEEDQELRGHNVLAWWGRFADAMRDRAEKLPRSKQAERFIDWVHARLQDEEAAARRRDPTFVPGGDVTRAAFQCAPRLPAGVGKPSARLLRFWLAVAREAGEKAMLYRSAAEFRAGLGGDNGTLFQRLISWELSQKWQNLKAFEKGRKTDVFVVGGPWLCRKDVEDTADGGETTDIDAIGDDEDTFSEEQVDDITRAALGGFDD